ncbi:signal peptidase I [Kocuria polaris]|nr:signal peptidase I [Kocuria polaris]
MARRAAARPRGSRAARLLGDALLNVAAAGGAVCIVLAVCAFVFDVSLLMFKTGSMEPTIPTGSVAVARAVPAADVQVGQIVTVDRPGQLPVTHRITSIEPAEPGSAARTFTMRGDANRDDDPYPYTVEDVRRVFFHVPHAANVVVWFGNPYVLGGLTLGASVLVTWAFWPRGICRDEPADARGGGRHRGAAALVLIAGAVGAQTVFPTPAHAAGDESTSRGDVLRVSTRGDAGAMGNLRPGVPVPWQVGVWADTDESGHVSARLDVLGDPRLALDVTVRFCTGRWAGYDDAGGSSDGATCAGRNLGSVDLGTVAPGDAAELFTRVPADEARWMLFDVRIAGGTGPQAQGAQGASTALRVTASGFGEDVGVQPPRPDPDPTPSPTASPTSTPTPTSAPVPTQSPVPTETPAPGPGDLPDTGARMGLAWLGGAAVVLGSVLLEARRRARRNRGESDAG